MTQEPKKCKDEDCKNGVVRAWALNGRMGEMVYPCPDCAQDKGDYVMPSAYPPQPPTVSGVPGEPLTAPSDPQQAERVEGHWGIANMPEPWDSIKDTDTVGIIPDGAADNDGPIEILFRDLYPSLQAVIRESSATRDYAAKLKEAELEKVQKYGQELCAQGLQLEAENVELKARIEKLDRVVEAAENIDEPVVHDGGDHGPDYWSCCQGIDGHPNPIKNGHRADCWWIRIRVALASLSDTKGVK